MFSRGSPAYGWVLRVQGSCSEYTGIILSMSARWKQIYQEIYQVSLGHCMEYTDINGKLSRPSLSCPLFCLFVKVTCQRALYVPVEKQNTHLS